jgi:saccharopine dehydrogenase-like NADP-dependent oxidoreductase
MGQGLRLQRHLQGDQGSMTKRVLIIGAYGNFGSYITKKLAAESDIQVIVAGRSEEKCRVLAEKYKTEYCVLDITKDLPASLQKVKPDIVIHTSGPFQGQGYDVAEACINCGCHYIDLADGREFVANIGRLDQKAKEKGVMVISGASSVPCLTSAIIDQYLPEFQKLTSIDYGITTAQRTNTGLATTAAVLGYAGKPFKTLIRGKMQNVYGWQGLAMRKYPELGYRLLGNCDIPDLALFPARYKDLETIHFRAGLEISLLHFGLWKLSWLVRLGMLKSLEPFAPLLLKASRLFDCIGSDRSAFHMEIFGIGKNGSQKTTNFYLIAKSGHGPFIPSIPSILCAKMLARGEIKDTGARPCIGIISLEQYMTGLRDLDITSLIKQ